MRQIATDMVSRRAAMITVALAAPHAQLASAIAAPSLLTNLRLPLSWTGTWSVQRSVTSISGDRQLAEKSWRLLGGTGTAFSAEHYQTRFFRVQSDSLTDVAAVDWGFDVSSRAGIPDSSVIWDGARRLRYARGELVVLEREVYPPGASFGATELLVAREELLADGRGTSTVPSKPTLRVSRSFRIDQAGVIEAREVVKTFDASATSDASADLGSTSTTRSTLTMREIVRPLGDSVKREVAYPESRGGYGGVY